MFNSFYGILAIVLASICAGAFVSVPVMLARKGREKNNDEWRDRPPGFIRLLRPMVRLYTHRIEMSMDSQKRDMVLGRLTEAGYGYVLSPEEFVVMRRLGLLIAVFLVVYILLIIGITSSFAIVFSLVLVPLGFFYPDIWLRDVIEKRKTRIDKDFPFFLEVIVLAMNAGLTFNSAIKQAVQRIPDGPLKQEFVRFLRETRTGLSRKEALERLSSRINMSSISNFTATLIQAAETGGSISAVLVEQAKQRRQERFIRAEKKANKAPVKLLGPLLGLLFPITFIIIGFPLVIKFIDAGIHKVFING
ncbi:MAG: type II secretion system F family protein [Candidatus Thiodiazotropha sp. (ex Myrtea sp. 'scaly one' KF741663)]|nr:type II secretion system F family protein [Candidatus Thiodiazotropha sp. (ex Myrtea sp. 'scaly one' KF741663)]